MCQAKPGFRCSAHTKNEIASLRDEMKDISEKAQNLPHRIEANVEMKDYVIAKQKYDKAVLDYYGTNKGAMALDDKCERAETRLRNLQKEKREGGNVDYNDVYKANEEYRKLKVLREKADENHNYTEMAQAIKNGEPVTDFTRSADALKSSRIDHDTAMKVLNSSQNRVHMNMGRLTLAQNTGITPKTLNYLADTYDPQGKAGTDYEGEFLASNPRLDADAQMKILKKAKGLGRVKEKMAINPNLSTKAKKALLDDSEYRYASNISRHTQSNSAPILKRLSNVKSASAGNLISVAHSKNVNAPTLHNIAVRAVTEKKEGWAVPKDTPAFTESDKKEMFQSILQSDKVSPKTVEYIKQNTQNEKVLELANKRSQ